MAKDIHLDRIKAVKRVSRIETGGPHGKAGTHADKMEKRARRMGTKEWLEEVEEEEEFLEDDHDEMDLDSTTIMVVCSLCGNPTPADTVHLHHGKLIGECCWDERLRTTE
jgi:formylmethanofuran dehydrogenase subunit E